MNFRVIELHSFKGNNSICLLSVTLNLICVELKHNQNVLHMFSTSIKYIN